MRLRIERLGPISDSEVEFGDITLFLGPPNTGKSYTLRALYSKLSLLDDYAVKALERSLSKIITMDLDRTLPGHVSEVIGVVVESAVKAVVTAMLLSSDEGLRGLEEYLAALGRRGGFTAGLKKREGVPAAVFTVSLPRISVGAGKLREAVKEALHDYTGRMIPRQYVEKVVLEPADPLRLNIRMIEYYKEREARLGMGRIALFLEDLLHYLEERIAAELTRRLPEKSLPRVSITRYMRRYRGFTAKIYVHIEPSDNGVVLLPTLKLTAFLPELSILTSSAGFKGFASKEVEEMIEDAFKGAREASLSGAEKRVADYVRTLIVELLADTLSETLLRDWLGELMRNKLGYQEVRFIPFGRSILVLGLESAANEPLVRPKLLHKLVDEFYPGVVASYLNWASLGRSRLLEERLSNEKLKLLEAFTALLEGNLVAESGRLYYNDWRHARVELGMASALVEEVSGMLFVLLSVERDSLVLVEEPEAQLHPGAQIVMALLLASLPRLCGCRVVASTHSDLLAITLSQLAVQKPDSEWVKDLLKQLLPSGEKESLTEGVEVLSKYVAESVRGLELRVYEFTREGEVRSIRPKEVLSREVPGISRVVDVLTDWSFRLASYRANGGYG